MQPLLIKRKRPLKSLASVRGIIAYLLFFIIAGQLSFAKSQDDSSKLIEYLAQENLNQTLIINKAKIFSPPKDSADLQQRLKQNTVKQTLNKSKINSFKDFLISQQKIQDNLHQQIKRIQHQVIQKNTIANTQLRLSKLETLLAVNKTTIELINNNISLANQYQKSLADEENELKLWQLKANYSEKISKLNEKEKQIKITLNQHYQQNIDQKQHGKSEGTNPDGIADETNIFLNNLTIRLIQQQLNDIVIQKQLFRSDYLVLKQPTPTNVQVAINAYQKGIEQNTEMKDSAHKMLLALDEDRELIRLHSDTNSVPRIKRKLGERINYIENQNKLLTIKVDEYQQLLTKQMSSRLSLSIYRADNLSSIVTELLAIPGQFYQYLKTLALMNSNNYAWKEPFSAAFFWLVLLIIPLFALDLNRRLTVLLTHDKERSRLTGYLYDGGLTLLQRNIPHLCVFSLLISCFAINRIAYSHYQLIVSLCTVYLTFRSMIIIARLSLLERISDSSGKDVKLYYRLKWLLLSGGWATALMVLSHQLHLSVIVQDIFNRFFMMFILAISLVTWRSRDVLPYLLSPYLSTKKRYYRNAVKLLVILLPFTLFTTALLGLTGYVNLAWTMSQYQASIMLMLATYVLVRGLLFDALELLSEWMISSLKNGWLWIEVALKPLDKLLRFCIFVTGVFILFQILGASSNEKLMNQLEALVVYPIINVSGVHITLMSIAEFTILLSVFVWASKWTREFCYRWVYRNAKDAGIRNSLAVFSQYAVILLGSFITLRVLGLDFSGMSMILGGLAVGMGFGLRDFASNIIGGLMLLIERPVREGDIITLGEFEGRVSHIGIRSMRVSSWDNMEILIPNAETFNKSFINWTHQDNIVRTIVPIKVCRSDDPLIVQQLILDTLAIVPEILTNPPVQVYLKQVDDALIEFEIRYYINVEQCTRVEIRSKFLFEITAKFKAAGLKAPIPPIHVEFAESKSEQLASIRTT